MTDNLDELKRKWQEMSARVDQLEETNLRLTECLAHSKVSSMQEQLADSVRRWGYVGFVLPIIAPTLTIVLHLPLWYALLYAVFGLVSAFNSFMFAKYIMAESLAEQPVAQAVKRAIKIRIRQHRRLISCFACAAILITIGAFLLPPGYMRTEVLIGGIVGLIIGLSIRIPRVMNDIRLAKNMVESLKED